MCKGVAAAAADDEGDFCGMRDCVFADDDACGVCDCGFAAVAVCGVCGVCACACVLADDVAAIGTAFAAPLGVVAGVVVVPVVVVVVAFAAVVSGTAEGDIVRVC